MQKFNSKTFFFTYYLPLYYYVFFSKDELINVVTIGCEILLYLNISFNENLTDSTIRYISK